ncbi:hypothetical protein HPP92_009164 [Vanilla planifolia]|uniref:Glycosyltransferase n=1 Tax=Vanilla planifolia TaxID=51239 RepID=A0A835RBV4_VANPL|nr:hypothetical protein HPP92_009164 [Vanilla planifolia]
MESNPNRLPRHVVLFPSPGMGHLIPFVELAKQLVVRHQLTATIVTFADFQASTLLSSLPSSISNATLPPPPLDDLPPKAHIITRISYTMARAASPLRELLASLSRSTRVSAVFVDLLGGDTLSAARELGIPTYIFFTSNFFCLSFFLHLPALDEATTGEYRDLPEPLRLPGCVDLWGEDFLEPIQDRSNDACSWVVHHARNHRLVDGIIVDSFEAPETDAAEFFKQNELGVPPIWGIGPLTWASSKPNSDPHNCLGWLDEQPDGSVLLLCFGSGGTLSWQQTQELALGLEMSGQRFLWAARSPSEEDPSASFFENGGDANDDPLGFLPDGFLQRTKGRGMVVPSWVPQWEVLCHVATSGFLSHCGWNSTLECLVHGVPMIAWPLYSEQRMNAVLLVEGMKVALRPEQGEDGVVGREQVATVVRELMVGKRGKEVRRRMREMKEEAKKAVAEGGSSWKAMGAVVGLLKGAVLSGK